MTKPTKISELEERGIVLPFDGRLSPQEQQMLDRRVVTGRFVPVYSKR